MTHSYEHDENGYNNLDFAKSYLMQKTSVKIDMSFLLEWELITYKYEKLT